MKEIILDLLFCFAATLFFALIMNAPKNTLVATSIIASIGYLIYTRFSNNFNITFGYFAGTAFVAMMGEILARKLKMPATIFIFPAVIPIVPGFGLYQTMLTFVQNDITQAMAIGATTILNIAAMAVAMAFVSVVSLKIRRKSN